MGLVVTESQKPLDEFVAPELQAQWIDKIVTVAMKALTGRFEGAVTVGLFGASGTRLKCSLEGNRLRPLERE